MFGLNSVLLGAVFFIGGALSRLPDPYWALTYISFIPIFIVNNKIIFFNKSVFDIEYNKEKIGIGQWTILILGFCLLLFSVLGIVFADQLPQ